MRSALTILAGAFCATLAVAQPGATTRTETSSTTTTTQYHRITNVVGTSFTVQRESVGKVVDVVFNQLGCIEYLLVQDAEGFIVVPWSVATVNYEQKSVTVQSSTVTVDQIRQVRYAEGRLPNFSDPAFVGQMRTVWGASAVGGGAGAGRTGAGAGPTDPGRPGAGTTSPDRKGGTTPPGTGTTPPTRKGGTTPPDRKGGTTPPDRTNPGTTTPPAKDPGTGTTPPRRGSDDPPAKTDPKNPPKKDKDGR